MTRSKLMVWALGLAALVAALLWLAHRPHIYRYKLTVEVATANGPRTGAAVREIKWRDCPRITPDADMASMTERGEAVMVELPDGQILLALLSPDVQQTVNAAFGPGIASKLAARKDKRIVTLAPPDQPEALYGESGYPRLVRFADPGDPSTVEKVDPRNLAASFGSGTILKRITAQMTEEPVTSRVGDDLPWLAGYRDKMLDGERVHRVQSPLMASHLNSLAFRRDGE